MPSGTDTDSTADSDRVGGLGKYCYGQHNLVHQHWVSQVESAGGFNVHDTEGPEAHHKLCMVLPAARVRHFSNVNATQENMHNYLLHGLLFKSLHKKVWPSPYQCNYRERANRVFSPLRGDPMGRELTSVLKQATLIHPEVRVARVELLDLFCAKFRLPTTNASYKLFERVEWVFGQKLIRHDGEVYWATDSQYSVPTDGRLRRRRDNLLLCGDEPYDVVLPDGRAVKRDTRLCCRAICFITLKYVSRLGLPTQTSLLHLLHEDKLTVALVRWFEPHPTAVERCSRALPLCPGIFGINHCLWRYARCPRSRKVLIADNGQPTKFFAQQAKMFGKTETEQLQRLHDESHAWYDIIFPNSIEERAHMLPEFEIHSHKFSSTWLQTITLV